MGNDRDADAAVMSCHNREVQHVHDEGLLWYRYEQAQAEARRVTGIQHLHGKFLHRYMSLAQPLLSR